MTMYAGVHVESLLCTKRTETITNNLKCDKSKKKKKLLQKILPENSA